jgi:hypothetical protein
LKCSGARSQCSDTGWSEAEKRKLNEILNLEEEKKVPEEIKTVIKRVN